MRRTVPLPTLALTLLLALFLAIVVGLLLTQPWSGADHDREQAAERASVPVGRALGGPAQAGYRRALAPRPFEFPADHGPHPDFRVEWWYLTGNLATVPGRRFGYQLTLFRVALAPPSTEAVSDEESPWRSRQVYMGHFALTDVAAGRHHGFERYSRAALGLAGAQAQPFRVWLEDWRLDGDAEGLFPLRLRAAEGDFALDLNLSTDKPLVLQGDRGLSQKSGEPGNASYYYSATRLTTRGTVTTAAGRHPVSGSSWLDREWSTSALGSEQSGWDWFALQLDDGRELMVYRLRRHDGSSDPFSSGVLVAADGSSEPLGAADVSLTPLGSWVSPATGDRYPAAWRLQLPARQLDLEVRPLLADQEMRLSVRYWEGAVEVSGSGSGRPVRGRGYLEMTRY